MKTGCAAGRHGVRRPIPRRTSGQGAALARQTSRPAQSLAAGRPNGRGRPSALSSRAESSERGTSSLPSLCAQHHKDEIPRSEDSARNDNGRMAVPRQARRTADAESSRAAGRTAGRFCSPQAVFREAGRGTGRCGVVLCAGRTPAGMRTGRAAGRYGVVTCAGRTPAGMKTGRTSASCCSAGRFQRSAAPQRRSSAADRADARQTAKPRGRPLGRSDSAAGRGA